MVVGTPCPSLPVTNLADGQQTTIQELAAGKVAVIDFWTTKCVRCPLAIEKLNAKCTDPKYENLAFFTICMDVAGVAKDIVEEEEWDNLTHTFMEFDQKEFCKAHFGFKSVPHYVVVDQAGLVVHSVATKFDMKVLDACLGTASRAPAAPATPAKAAAAPSAGTSPAMTPVQAPADVERAAVLRKENEELKRRIALLTADCEGESTAAAGAAVAIVPPSETDEATEYLLRDNPGKFVIFPIGDQNCWSKYKQAETGLWTAEEVDLSKEAADIASLSAGERGYVLSMLTHLMAEDTMADESLVERFAQEVQIAEARFFFGFQMAMHNIHAEVYSMLLGSYETDAAARDTLIDAASATPTAMKKAAWCTKWLANAEHNTFAQKLTAFTAFQGIFGCASFASIFYLKSKRAGLLPGLSHANDLIARDEKLYTDFSSMLYGLLQNPPSDDTVLQIIKEAVEIEQEFAATDFDVTAIGMDAAAMSSYVESVADHLLTALNCEKHYNSPNPFDWMETHVVAAAAVSETIKLAPVAPAAEGMGGLSFDMDDDF